MLHLNYLSCRWLGRTRRETVYARYIRPIFFYYNANDLWTCKMNLISEKIQMGKGTNNNSNNTLFEWQEKKWMKKGRENAIFDRTLLLDDIVSYNITLCICICIIYIYKYVNYF